MDVTRTALRYPVTTWVVFLSLLILGIISYLRMPTDLLPAAGKPSFQIVTRMEGYTAEEIERLVTDRMESRIASVRHVSSLSSVSKQDYSVITVDFDWDVDRDLAQIDLLKAVYNVLPKEAEEPKVYPIDPSEEPVFQLSLAGDYSIERMTAVAHNTLKREIERVPGVAGVEILGGRNREARVLLDPDRLAEYSLSASGVFNRIAEVSTNITGGRIEDEERIYQLIIPGHFSNVRDISEIVIGGEGTGRPVRLSEVADVYEVTAPPESILRVNGNNGVGVSVTKEAAENSLAVVKKIKDVLDEIGKKLPGGLRLEIIYEPTEFIERAIRDLKIAALVGLALVILVLWAFLRSLSGTYAVTLALPLSIFATFIPLYFSGVSLNVISIGGLALGAGMLVDGSIVVLESIARRRESGEEPAEAAVAGTAEVRRPITAAVLTTVIVFLPVIYIKGLTAEFFKEQALAVCYSLLFSLAVSIFLIPLVVSARAGRSQRNAQGKAGREEAARTLYEKALRAVLRRPLPLLVLSLLLVILAGFLFPRIERSLLPPQESRHMAAELAFPRQYSLEGAGERLDEVERGVEPLKDLIERYHIQLGQEGHEGRLAGAFSGRPYEGRLTMKLKKAGDAARAAALLGRSFSSIPELSFRVSGAMDPVRMLLGADEAPVVIEVRGPYEEVLGELTARIVDHLRGFQELSRVDSDILRSRKEVLLDFDDERLVSLGINRRYLADQIQAALGRKELGVMNVEGSRLRKVFIEGAGHRGFAIESIGNIPVSVPPDREETGGEMDTRKTVFLKDIARLTVRHKPEELHRTDRQRAHTIHAYPVEGLTNALRKKLADDLAAFDKPPGFSMRLGGIHVQFLRSFRELGFALLLSLVLVYMVLASLYESFKTPFIILLTLPLASIGIVPPLLLFRVSLNVATFIGIIMLGGIVVNNAIVLVDCIARLIREGRPVEEAVIRGSLRRFRPVLMTTLTTILALLPLAFGFGGGAELRRPIAVVVIGGLVSSTFLTLFVIPAFYRFFPTDSPRTGGGPSDGGR